MISDLDSVTNQFNKTFLDRYSDLRASLETPESAVNENVLERIAKELEDKRNSITNNNVVDCNECEIMKKPLSCIQNQRICSSFGMAAPRGLFFFEKAGLF